MQPPKQVIVSELFPILLEELLSLLRNLSEEEWTRATICLPWSVKDICLHLLGGDFSNLSWKRDGFSIFSEIASYEHLVQLVNEHNAHWVANMQHLSPKLLIDTLKFTGEQVTEYFQSLDPLKSGVPVDWVSSAPAPVWLDLAREYTERWHHQQHIRDAINKPGLKEAKFLGPVLDTFILALPRTYKDVIVKEEIAININTSGNIHRDWVLSYQSNQWILCEGFVENPKASLFIDSDLLWRVFTKGISVEDAKNQSKLSGDKKIAEKLLETISIIA